MEDIENVIDSISPDKRSFLVDASGAIALSRQMLSRYFNRREYVPAALMFITDASSTDNAELVVSHLYYENLPMKYIDIFFPETKKMKISLENV